MQGTLRPPRRIFIMNYLFMGECMKTCQEIVMIVIAALGLLLAVVGCNNQAGPQISGLFIAEPVFAGTASRAGVSCTMQVQENRLYEISARTLILAETLAACARHDIVCSEEDGRALQAKADNALQDLLGLIKSGDMRGLALTAEEGEALRAWSQEVRDRFSRIEILEGSCKRARMLVSLALQLMHTVIA